MVVPVRVVNISCFGGEHPSGSQHADVSAAITGVLEDGHPSGNQHAEIPSDVGHPATSKMVSVAILHLPHTAQGPSTSAVAVVGQQPVAQGTVVVMRSVTGGHDNVESAVHEGHVTEKL